MQNTGINESWKNEGIWISLETDCAQQEHQHAEIELVYVLSGTVRVTMREEKYLLHTGDVICINAKKPHRILTKETSLVCCVYMDYGMLLSKIRYPYAIFNCNSQKAMGREYDPLRKVLNLMLVEYVNCKEYPSLRLLNDYYKMVHYMSDYFMTTAKTGKEKPSKEKINQILTYINENYAMDLSLKDVADHFQMSESYLSRYFKQKTNTNFVTYVCRLRIHNAASDILSSDRKITSIALDHGFMTPSSFNRVFRKEYHMSPTEYRKSHLCG